MTNRSIEQFGSVEAARAAFKHTTWQQFKAKAQPLFAEHNQPQTRAINAAIRSMMSGHATVADLSGWTNQETIDHVRELGPVGVGHIDTVLEKFKRVARKPTDTSSASVK